MQDETTPVRDDENASDHGLMARIGRGDHDAFRQLIERHQRTVTGTVARMLGNPSDAEDISQQVFLRVWRHAGRYRPEAKFTTYLLTITRHLVFNETRRRGRKREISIEERAQTPGLWLEAPPDHRPDAEMQQAELRQAVDAAIASLPDAQRMAVVLRRHEQLSYEEIADVMQLTVSAVKSLLFRARGNLRDALADHLDDADST